jgi:hypothetical protein
VVREKVVVKMEAGSWGGQILNSITEKWCFQKPIHDFAFLGVSE